MNQPPNLLIPLARTPVRRKKKQPAAKAAWKPTTKLKGRVARARKRRQAIGTMRPPLSKEE